MFSNPRYLTRGFQSTVPLMTQFILFHMIDRSKTTRKLDYLQVFILSVESHNGQSIQKIIHSQEQPSWSKTSLISLENPITAKIYVIDDGDHHTFLLDEEY